MVFFYDCTEKQNRSNSDQFPLLGFLPGCWWSKQPEHGSSNREAGLFVPVHTVWSRNTFKTVFIHTEVQTEAEPSPMCKLCKAHSCLGARGKAVPLLKSKQFSWNFFCSPAWFYQLLLWQWPCTHKGIVDEAWTRRCCWVEWKTADTEQASQYQRQHWLLQTAPKLAITHAGQCTKEYQIISGCKLTTNNWYSNYTSALYRNVSKTGTPVWVQF